MKLERISLRNFLSHEETDWQLDGCRLATLVGPNGAGKSSLLDAILYALFDSARGRTDDLVRLGATDMSAAVTFSYAGGRYRITRGRTTKARGGSYLEFAIEQADGSWRPLTGDTIKETTEAIGALLRMDADTFETAVLLGQGKASRFAEATAGDRKRILGQVLGLEVWEHAETVAREEARDLEVEQTRDSAALARIAAELVDRGTHEAALAQASEVLTDVEADNRKLDAEREAAMAQRLDLIARISAADAVRAIVAQRTQELEALRERYRKTTERKTAAEARIRETDAAIAAEGPVAEPVDVEAIEARIATLERAQADAAAVEKEIREKQDGVREIKADHDRKHLAWSHGIETAKAREVELVDAVSRLAPVTCTECGARIIVDQAGLRVQLGLARQRQLDLIKAEPEMPMHLAIEDGKIERLQARLRSITVDPAALQAARVELTAAHRAESRAARIAGAQAAKADAERTVAQVIEELAEIRATGDTAKAALDEAAAQVSAASGDRVALNEAEAWLGTIADLLREHASVADNARATIARETAALERLAALDDEHDELQATVNDRGVRVARLRRLVGAFGVTGIPARIIESVLPELAGHANALLSELRPGMSLEIRAQRAKKDGKGIVEALDLIVTDPAGERALALFSGGERMSVSLAVAVALSRLIARRAGTAIRSLVIDEPDGLDADARRSFGQALRVLAHQGELERVILVSHHMDLAEIGDAVFEVSKNGHGSVVTQIG